jgi:hypothetical protein
VAGGITHGISSGLSGGQATSVGSGSQAGNTLTMDGITYAVNPSTGELTSLADSYFTPEAAQHFGVTGAGVGLSGGISQKLKNISADVGEFVDSPIGQVSTQGVKGGISGYQQTSAGLDAMQQMMAGEDPRLGYAVGSGYESVQALRARQSALLKQRRGTLDPEGLNALGSPQGELY